VKRFALLPILLLASALAAEVLRFEPALGTVSQYRLRQKTVATVLQSGVTTSDNSPVPAAFANLTNTLASALNSEQTQDMTEKVMGIAPDGSRQLETVVSSTSNGQKIGYTVFSSLSPLGMVTVQKAEYDEATKKLLQGTPFELPLELFTEIPAVYGKPLEVGASFTVVSKNTTSLSAFEAIAKSVGGTAKLEGLETATTYTYQGKNSAAEFVFGIKSNTTAGKLSLESSSFSLEQTSTSSTASGELVYLPDGRAKLSNSVSQQRLKQVQSINLGSSKIIVALEADLTTEVRTELFAQ
jgi:hypothetical protein